MQLREGKQRAIAKANRLSLEILVSGAESVIQEAGEIYTTDKGEGVETRRGLR